MGNRDVVIPGVSLDGLVGGAMIQSNGCESLKPPDIILVMQSHDDQI